MKYKVGDKVRIVTSTFSTAGLEGEIIILEPPEFYHVDEQKHGSRGFPYREYEIELIVPIFTRELI